MTRSGIGPAPPSARVAPPDELVHERLRDVLDRGEPAGHVAVQRRVADGVLALVPGREHQPAEPVGHGHQQVAADPRLEVLLGESRVRRPGTSSSSAVEVPGEQVVDRRSRRAGSRAGAATSAASSTLSGEEYRDGIASARTASGPSASTAMHRDERGVDPAREPEHDLAEPVLADVVPQAEHERSVDLLEVLAAIPVARARSRARPSMSTTSRSSSNRAARWAGVPSGRTTTLPPSKTSSSCPPTAFTYTIHAFVSRARSRQISRRSADLPRWYGDPLMLHDHGRSPLGVVVARRARHPRVLADGQAELRAREADRTRRVAGRRTSVARRTRRSSAASPCGTARPRGRRRSDAAALWMPRSVRSTKPTTIEHPPAVRRASVSRASRLSSTNAGRRTRSSGG